MDVAGTGVNIVSFSSDKLLGGPQGGIILGDSDLISKMKENHLSRVLRVGKLTLAGLERTLVHYWYGEYDRIPVLKMIDTKIEDIRSRAEKFAGSLREALPENTDIITSEGHSAIGGGTFPNNPLPTVLVEIILQTGQADRLSRLLREESPAVLVRVRKNSLLIDLRTVLTDEEMILKQKIINGIGSLEGGSDRDA